jgi:hypothetical protein
VPAYASAVWLDTARDMINAGIGVPVGSLARAEFAVDLLRASRDDHSCV